MHADEHFVALGGELEASLFTKDKNDLLMAKGVLNATLRSTFLAVVTVCDVLEYKELVPSATEHIEKLAVEKGVRLKENVIGEFIGVRGLGGCSHSVSVCAPASTCVCVCVLVFVCVGMYEYMRKYMCVCVHAACMCVYVYNTQKQNRPNMLGKASHLNHLIHFLIPCNLPCLFSLMKQPWLTVR